MKKLIALLVATSGALALVGCNQETGDLSKNDDQTLRHNMSRPLNADELSHMGSAKPKEASAAGRPNRTKG